mmetsp:Transcript_22502/g.50694  ORF Transcript_22502/g.50694 Transcript_22502/m.50694 type:complete len:219 (-) Transcript_22502:242-898(-)
MLQVLLLLLRRQLNGLQLLANHLYKLRLGLGHVLQVHWQRGIVVALRQVQRLNVQHLQVRAPHGRSSPRCWCGGEYVVSLLGEHSVQPRPLQPPHVAPRPPGPLTVLYQVKRLGRPDSHGVRVPGLGQGGGPQGGELVLGAGGVVGGDVVVVVVLGELQPQPGAVHAPGVRGGVGLAERNVHITLAGLATLWRLTGIPEVHVSLRRHAFPLAHERQGG